MVLLTPGNDLIEPSPAAIAALLLLLLSVPFVALNPAARIHLAPLARKQGVSEGVALLRQLFSALCDLLFTLLAAEGGRKAPRQGCVTSTSAVGSNSRRCTVELQHQWHAHLVALRLS